MSGAKAECESTPVLESSTRDLRRARRLLVLTPLGLLVGFLLVMGVASSMGIGVVSVVMEGPPATTLQAAVLIVIGVLAVLGLPVAAGFYALGPTGLAIRRHGPRSLRRGCWGSSRRCSPWSACQAGPRTCRVTPGRVGP